MLLEEVSRDAFMIVIMLKHLELILTLHVLAKWLLKLKSAYPHYKVGSRKRKALVFRVGNLYFVRKRRTSFFKNKF